MTQDKIRQTLMRCIQIIAAKPEFVEAQVPEPKDGERLIKVKAFAINRADLLQIDGLYNAPDASNIPGLEVSGLDVESGEEVCALVASGAYAEYVCVSQLQVFPKPKALGFREAAALPEALVTGYMNLFKNAKAEGGQTALIHGGSSGIGSFAIQMCKLKGVNVIASVGEQSKGQRCMELGAQLVVDYKDDFGALLKGRVDIVLDILGGQHLLKNLSCLRMGGKLCLIAVMSGSEAEINLAAILMKNLSIMGSTLRSKSASEKHELIKSALLEFGAHIESGDLKPVIDSVYGFDELQMALQRVRSRDHFGKVVVEF